MNFWIQDKANIQAAIERKRLSRVQIYSNGQLNSILFIYHFNIKTVRVYHFIVKLSIINHIVFLLIRNMVSYWIKNIWYKLKTTAQICNIFIPFSAKLDIGHKVRIFGTDAILQTTFKFLVTILRHFLFRRKLYFARHYAHCKFCQIVELHTVEIVLAYTEEKQGSGIFDVDEMFIEWRYSAIVVLNHISAEEGKWVFVSCAIKDNVRFDFVVVS